jgi:hypothetical protein
VGREDEAAEERRLHRSRFVSVFPDGEGTYLVRGRVPPEVGALLMRAIEAASDALYRGSVPETTPEQRRADALALLAERALAAGFGGEGPGEAEAGEETEARRAPIGTPAERYLVVLHVDAATLAADGEPGSGGARLEDGTRVSAEGAMSFALLTTRASRSCLLGSGGTVLVRRPWPAVGDGRKGGREPATSGG